MPPIIRNFDKDEWCEDTSMDSGFTGALGTTKFSEFDTGGVYISGGGGWSLFPVSCERSVGAGSGGIIGGMEEAEGPV